jgi:hypothetical protein
MQTKAKRGNQYTSNQIALTIDGETRTVLEWSETSGVSAKVIYARIKYGWDAKKCVFHRAAKGEHFKSHGLSHLPEYTIWLGMVSRCHTPSCSNFKFYGGRGISVCERWRGSFRNFLDDMGSRPTPKHTIEREKSTGNYEPGNCIWATWDHQANNRRNTVVIEHNGQSKPLTVWAKEVGLKPATLWARISDYGWSVDRALSTPPRKRQCTPCPPQ